MTQPWLHTCFCLKPREFKHLLPKMWWEMLWELCNNGAFFLPFVITTRQVSGSESALDSFWGKHPARSGQSISSASHKAETENGLGWLFQRRICSGVGGIPVGCCHWPEHEFECRGWSQIKVHWVHLPQKNTVTQLLLQAARKSDLLKKSWHFYKEDCEKQSKKDTLVKEGSTSLKTRFCEQHYIY